MRCILLATVVLAVGCGKESRDVEPAENPEATPGAAPALPADPPPLHSEQGKSVRIVIEEDTHYQRPVFKTADGQTIVSGQIKYHRVLFDGVLHGSQARKLDYNAFDMFQALTAGNPWDNLTNAGAIHAFDMRQEPINYHHRSGPVGAVLRELRSRKGGADAKAPVAIFGLTAGTPAAYALKGQKFTFYETDPAVKKLVADTDKYFSYVADARKRGAEVEIRVGNQRANLKEDKNRKYAVMLIDLAESFPIPRAIFTKEAVQEYFDRMTEDGILALHISNKYYRFEPMIARIAEELKLTARVWNDDAEGLPGKTASSWMVLARSEKALGKLALPTERQQTEHGSSFRPTTTHPDVPAWTDKKAEIVDAMKFKP